MSVAMMKRINLLNTRWQYHFDPVLVLFEIFRIASCVSQNNHEGSPLF